MSLLSDIYTHTYTHDKTSWQHIFQNQLTFKQLKNGLDGDSKLSDRFFFQLMDQHF